MNNNNNKKYMNTHKKSNMKGKYFDNANLNYTQNNQLSNGIN